MRNWKTIVGVIGIFLLGMVAGGLVVGGAAARRIHRYRAGQPVYTADEVTHFLKRRLDLDAAQQPHVRAIVVDAQAQMQDMRRANGGVISNALEKMQPVLRADQRDKLDRLVAERRARRLE